MRLHNYAPVEPNPPSPLEVDGPNSSILSTILTKIGTKLGAHICSKRE